jgi:hypothetical protein
LQRTNICSSTPVENISASTRILHMHQAAGGCSVSFIGCPRFKLTAVLAPALIDSMHALLVSFLQDGQAAALQTCKPAAVE